MASKITIHYTMGQVKEHNKPNNLWIVINDLIYDVSAFRFEVSIKRLYCYCKLCNFFVVLF